MNKTETETIRRSMRRTDSVKITLNVDADSLGQVRSMAEESGVPYQRLLNTLLRERLNSEVAAQSRLDKLEQDVEMLKRKLAI